MKVLLPVDESEFSELAVQEIEKRFATPEMTVRVLHVVGAFVPPAAAFLEAGGSLEETREQVASSFKELVDRVAERLKAHGVASDTAIRDGNPGKVIVSEAKEWGADLIVMGSHGRGPLLRALLGSVAQYVVDHAPCSVEVVHDKEH